MEINKLRANTAALLASSLNRTRLPGLPRLRAALLSESNPADVMLANAVSLGGILFQMITLSNSSIGRP